MANTPRLMGDGSFADDPEWLKEQLRQREFEIKLLKETADAVSSQLQFDTVLQMIAERAQTLVNAESVLIPILSADCQSYTYKAGCGPHAEEIIGETLPRDYGVCGWVWNNRKPWWRGALDSLSGHERNRWEREAGSLIMVPLLGKAHFLGGIAAHNKCNGKEFDHRDLDILSLFASQVAIAIENAMHYQVLEKAHAEAELYQAELTRLNQRLAQSNEELEKLALYDVMTDLPNRTLYVDRLGQALRAAARNEVSVGVMVVDLDNFKEVNDTLGHDVGDNLLREVAARIQSVVRDSDTVGRLGGDEFALVLPACQQQDAIDSAKRLREVLKPPFQLGDARLQVTLSIGIALYPVHGEDIPTLLRHADTAMYQAKHERDGYVVYDTRNDPHSPILLAKRSALHQMLADQAVDLHYQPKIALDSGKVVGVEALARWHHAEWGWVPPDEFIPMLEQSGQMRVFTQVVLEKALYQQTAWREAGYDLFMAVNLTVQDIRDETFLERIRSLVMREGIRADRVILELTETAVMDKRGSTLEVLDAVRALGVEFSVDDFGTGYSSLSRLKHLPVSELKIDRSFISHMDTDSDDAVIARSTIELAHTLGLRVVAEGVETSTVMAQLRALGCDLAQGYHLSRPLPAADIAGYFDRVAVQRLSG